MACMQREEDVLHDATTLGDIEEFFFSFFFQMYLCICRENTTKDLARLCPRLVP
jgi:hypothetical protein